jgi:hypothetical protein
MFHVRKLSNTRSTPVVFSSKPTKTRWDHKQKTSIYLGIDARASRDTAPAPNHTSSTSTAKLSKPSTKPFHRRGRPSIDKSQVSKPSPTLVCDERDLFEAIASGNAQTRARRIPKAAEKRIKINVPGLIRSSPQPEPKAFDSVSSESWYSPAPAQSPTKGSLQRSVSSATPRTTLSKAGVGRTNSTKETRSHLRTGSETQKDCGDPAKRRIHKGLITHPDCPWIESNHTPYLHTGYLTQPSPVRSATWGSYDSDETAVEGEEPTRLDAEEGEITLSAKHVQDTLNPTVKLILKPLPDLPVSDSLSSRWSLSTGSVYSDGEPFQYDEILNKFPDTPKDIPTTARLDDWENSNSLSTPPIFMSCSNSSSSSIATITPRKTPTPPPLTKALMLKAVPEPKFPAVVRQNPRASHSFTHVQDSIAIRKAHLYPKTPTEDNTHASIRIAGTSSTLRWGPSSVTPSHGQSQSTRPTDRQALGFPRPRENPEYIERRERERLEWERNYKRECQKEQELKRKEQEQDRQKEEFERRGKELMARLDRGDTEIGIIPPHKRMYQPEADPNAFELIRPRKQRKWL